MNRIIHVIFFLSLFFSAILEANNSKSGVLIVKINNFSSSKGSIRSHIYNSPVGFPTESDSCYRMQIVKSVPKSKKATMVWNDLPYGTYALTVHHDENNSIWMDKNFLGYPTEAFGLSNNPKIVFSIPKWDQCKFKINKDTTIIEIVLKFT